MRRLVLFLICLTFIPLFSSAAAAKDEDPIQQRRIAIGQMNDGNYKNALAIFEQLLANPHTGPLLQVGNDLNHAINCLNQLNRIQDVDQLVEQSIIHHQGNWDLLRRAAYNYLHGTHYGYIVAGEFHRGGHRGGGRYVNSFERDRARAIQLLQLAVKAAETHNISSQHKSSLYLEYSNALLSHAGGNASWRLQALTDLEKLPDYDDSNYWYANNFPGTPSKPDGSAIFFYTPKQFADAANDGERWRWLLEQVFNMAPNLQAQVAYLKATQFKALYGVQTAAQSLGSYRPMGLDSDDGDDDPTRAYAVRTLTDEETITRLASGIKRYQLPEQFNYIHLLRSIIKKPSSRYKTNALQMLGDIFENRQQYVKAASIWRQALALQSGNTHYLSRLEAITAAWGRFKPGKPQVAGKAAALSYRFRNAKYVDMTITEINVKRLLKDVRAYIKSNATDLNYQKININNIGYRLVTQNDKKYLESEVAQWQHKLIPAKGHFDAETLITTPTKQAGAYLVTATVEGGNQSHIVMWLNDSILLQKPLSGKNMYFVADAKTGRPMADTTLEFFGYTRDALRLPKPLNNVIYKTEIKRFNKISNKDGLVYLDKDEHPSNYQWLVTVADNKHIAYLGFNRVWYSRYHRQSYRQKKYLAITDRPVYRPSQTVKFKLWIREARYDLDDTSRYANKSIAVEILNPKHEVVFSEHITTDAYGGLQGELPLPDNATLGIYTIRLPAHSNHGSNTFRVEEYKKPEFEVTVKAPEKPVQLGDTIKIKIKANYFFGAPVTKAKVKYKVLRHSETAQWYPADRWDWLYGRGYWWFAYEYTWYPNWHDWGFKRPIPFWWPQPRPAPELVSENEVELSEDGSVTIEIDTAVAKALHGDSDHRYEITASVTDASRRSIVGSSSVHVARKPFQIHAWVNRGYYRANDTVTAHFQAQTSSGTPIVGMGKASLYRIHYDQKGKTTEKRIEQWKLATNDRGEASQTFIPGSSGQYRIVYELSNEQRHMERAAYIFNVIGDHDDDRQFQFNPLELLPDKRSYASGDKAELMINTAAANSTVLLFERPSNGRYLKPKVLHLQGKSRLQTLAITKSDMPNIFVEAVTIRNGNIYTEIREIAVPPEKRTLNVSITTDKQTYTPGSTVQLNLKVTDEDGKPVSGSTVLTVYDKALEYISGGSNVPDIREYFWKWRRSHNRQQTSSIDRYFYNLVAPKQRAMSDIGVFGGLLGQAVSGKKDGFTRSGLAFRDKSRMEMKLTKHKMERGAPMPAMAAAPMSEMMEADADATGPAAAALVKPTIRKQFADTAYWNGGVQLDDKGQASLSFKAPENLSTWKIKGWALTHGTRVGETSAEVVTKKNVIVRLQAPRFFVEKDEVVLSANIHNYLNTAKRIKAVLELEGGQLVAMGKQSKIIHVEANGEQRVDWRVKVKREGETVIRMLALSDSESDAMEMSFPVYVHGMEKTESFTGSITNRQQSTRFTITVPQARRIDQTSLELRYSPSLALAMVDALPYLVGYPYGCTEQTLNRFLPTVITQNILKRMQLDLQSIRDKRSNLNAQEIGDDKQRAKQWKQRNHNPVFDLEEVQTMALHGMQRLEAMQVNDGGWGWFSGYGERSYPHTTAFVVKGLSLAKENGLPVSESSLRRGIDWLSGHQSQQLKKIQQAEKETPPRTIHANNIDAFIYYVLSRQDRPNKAMRDYLYRDRKQLAVYAKTLLALSLHREEQTQQLKMLVTNIEQYLIMDAENQTAYLEQPNNSYWWYWYGDDIEANAYYLKLLATIDPNSQKAAWLVKYLINNRKHATYWRSTRDTAIAIEALADYIKATKQDMPNMVLSIYIDGERKKKVTINKANLFSYDNKLLIQGKALTAGTHSIEIKREGQGPVFYNAYLKYFSLQDYIKKTGLEIKVERRYYKLTRTDTKKLVRGARGQALQQRSDKYTRTAINNLATLNSGDTVEVELIIHSKNDYEYLIFEDMKPAGFETIDVRSGYTQNDMGAYVEYRDEKVTFFVRQLARGKHSISYRMRAEIPGKFSALPTKAYAMYAPELKANADEIKLEVVDKE